jgi:hypothetical protein
MGFLFHAFKTGKLEEIAKRGLLIIDKSYWLGSGKLGDYANVTGNSIGKTFLACLEHENFTEVFGDLRDYSPLHKVMVEESDGAPLLSDAGNLLAMAAERLIAHLIERYDVTVLRGCEIDTIRRRDNGKFDIVYHDVRDPSARRTVSSDTVVMNLGGTQFTDDIDGLCTELGVMPPHGAVKAYASDDLLRQTTAQLLGTFATEFDHSPRRRPNRITVIGGSHSAFSVVDRLAVELGAVGLDEITVIHRSPIRLFFETVDEARAKGYEVNEATDVCPVTKRVNRSSGLRYRAFDIVRSITATGRVPGAKPRVELIEAGRGDEERNRASECLTDSLAVVHGAGYRPNISTLLDQDGEPIELQYAQGGLVSDKAGRPIDASGEVVKGLFTFGLGSGFRPDPQIGSEAAFTGRIYGVWIFHHDIGAKVLNGVLEALAEQDAPEAQPTMKFFEKRLARSRRR